MSNVQFERQTASCSTSRSTIYGYARLVQGKPMATLYVENVPDDLYDSLRKRAHQHRKSIAAEVLSLLEQNVVTPAELKARELFLRQVKRLRSPAPKTTGPFPSSEAMP